MADGQQMYRNKGGQRQAVYRPDGSSLIKQKGREIKTCKNNATTVSVTHSIVLQRPASVKGKDKVTSLLSQRKRA